VGVVRAGDRLTPEEIDALVAQRAVADGSHHCPLFQTVPAHSGLSLPFSQ
jgi:hypothetical protein